MRLLSLLLLLLPMHLMAQTVTLAVDPWPPFTGKNGKGVATKIVRTALARSGITLKTVDVPWTEAYEGSVAGRYDGVLAIWYDDERAKALLFSEPYMINRVVMVSRTKDKLVLGKLDDLAGHKVGVVKGYAYHPDFDASTAFTRVESTALAQSLQKLAQGKVDVVVDSEVAVERWLRANPKAAARLHVHEQAVAERALYVAINPHTPKAEAVVANFNTAIRAMQVDGSLRKLVQVSP
jgi:polar amino acid transport system substrate-binding protein